MRPETPSHWLHPRNVAQAREAQAEMAAYLVVADDLPARILRIGGADVSNTRFDPAKRVHAALVTRDAATDEPVASATESRVAEFLCPRLSGFREVPALVATWARLPMKPI